MNFHQIKYDDMLNGDGLRCVLFVSGCEHFCHNCHNPQTWNVNSGIEFTELEFNLIINYCQNDFVSGLTLSGGDPAHPCNLNAVTNLCKRFKQKLPTKTIWLYTGYFMVDLAEHEILNYVDVVVDGEYIENLADVNYEWAGSTNQKIYRKINGEWKLS